MHQAFRSTLFLFQNWPKSHRLLCLLCFLAFSFLLVSSQTLLCLFSLIRSEMCPPLFSPKLLLLSPLTLLSLSASQNLSNSPTQKNPTQSLPHCTVKPYFSLYSISTIFQLTSGPQLSLISRTNTFQPNPFCHSTPNRRMAPTKKTCSLLTPCSKT